MLKVTHFPSFVYFQNSYNKLEDNANNVYLVELYHRDMPSQPTVSIVDQVSEVFSDIGADESYISIRFVGGTDLTFTSESYNTNISNNAVIFSSKFDDETYCIIEFR